MCGIFWFVVLCGWWRWWVRRAADEVEWSEVMRRMELGQTPSQYT